AAVLFGLGLGIIRAQLFAPVLQLPLDKPPEVLASEAQQMLRDVGLSKPPADTAGGFISDDEYFRHVEKTDHSPDRWKNLSTVQPPPIQFWYRQSPRPMAPERPGWAISMNDPSETISGSAIVLCSTSGALVGLRVIPPEKDEKAGPWREPDWSS